MNGSRYKTSDIVELLGPELRAAGCILLPSGGTRNGCVQIWLNDNAVARGVRAQLEAVEQMLRSIRFQ